MILPAILERDWGEIEKKLEICRRLTRNVHIDFIDEKFASTTTFLDPKPFKKYSDYFNFEAHLMVDEPAKYLGDLSVAGFKTFLGQVEYMHDQVEFVAKGEIYGRVGLCLDLDTPIDELRVPLGDLDRILLMSVPAGKSGQVFDKKVLSKIKSLKEKLFDDIEVDGGIDDKTITFAKKSGAKIFCANSFLFNKDASNKYHILESLVWG